MKKLKKKIIEEPIFKTRVMFLGNCDYKKLDEVVRKTGNGIEDVEYLANADGAQLTFTDTDNPIRIVWRETLDKSAETMGVVAHEIFHLVIRICEWKGIPLDTENNADETGAYLMDYYFREFYKFINQ